MDDAPNYGNTGATIGHELTHGFDDEGRQVRREGQPEGLVDQGGRQASFRSARDCVSDQYSQYTVVDDIKINGKLTMGEDVADLGGTLLAYIAWKNATPGKNLQPIDGFTPDQRFFIGMAQWACDDERPEEQARQRDHRSAFARQVSHQRRGFELAGIREGVFLQGRSAHGARKGVPRLVMPPGQAPPPAQPSARPETRGTGQGEEGSGRRAWSRRVDTTLDSKAVAAAVVLVAAVAVWAWVDGRGPGQAKNENIVAQNTGSYKDHLIDFRYQAPVRGLEQKRKQVTR